MTIELIHGQDTKWTAGCAQLAAAAEAEAVRQGAIVMYLGTDDEDGATSLSEGDLFEETFEKIRNIRNLKNHPYQFYEKLGYRIVGVLPDVNGYGKPDIYMAKRLKKEEEGS